MGYTNNTTDGRRGLPVLLLALVLGLLLFGGISGPAPAIAETITCGDCHSLPPSDSDSACPKLTSKSHPAHVPGNCTSCHLQPATVHPSLTHNNGMVNVTSTVSPGLRYNTTSSTCTNACHKNKNASWGGNLDCNVCHFRNGATGNYAMSGLHAVSDRTWKHYSSPIKVNNQTITCVNCHPNNDSDTGTPKTHIGSSTFSKRADMSEAFQNVTVIGIGYTKGVTQGSGTCANSCHYNANDPFGNYTIYFKPGQSRRFGAYQSANWAEQDLKCNECHSTPGQEASFGHVTSFESKNANKRHEAHMFKYKLNPWNFQSEDRNIYCDDCHRTPDINMTRGFRHHSTIGEGGSGTISLPVKSQNSKVYLLWRNNGIGRDGATAPSFVPGTTSCDNIYCHTLMISGKWTEESCNACHGTNDGVNTGSGAPGFSNRTVANSYTYESYSGAGGAHFTHVTKRGYPCRTCHFDGGGDGNPANHMEGNRTVVRNNVNVGVHPAYWFNNRTSYYNLTTRSCNDVKCHYGDSQNWDCAPLN